MFLRNKKNKEKSTIALSFISEVPDLSCHFSNNCHNLYDLQVKKRKDFSFVSKCFAISAAACVLCMWIYITRLDKESTTFPSWCYKQNAAEIVILSRQCKDTKCCKKERISSKLLGSILKMYFVIMFYFETNFNVRKRLS